MTGLHHTAKIRSLVREARSRNARMTAAAIGSHLSDLTRTGAQPIRVGQAVEAVRDASLRLLTAVNVRDEAGTEREWALLTVEALDAAMQDDRS